LILVCGVCFVFGQGSKRILKFAYTSLPGSETDRGVKAFQAKLAELSNGALTIDVYPGGELYSGDGQAQAIRNGTLDMTLFGIEWFAGLMPEFGSLCSAYSIVDVDHLNRIFNEDNEVSRKIYQTMIKELGVVPVSTWYYGTRTLNLRGNRTVKVPQDMKSVKLRMQNAAGFISMAKALGAVPTPMALSEVYMALKTGTVDGQENPLPTTISRTFYEVTDSIILSKHYVAPITVYVNKRVYDSLTTQQQKWISEAIVTGKQTCDSLTTQNEANAVDFLKSKGLKIVDVDIPTWKAYAYSYYKTDPITKAWDLDFYEKVKALAK
jgi:tripartite ATP-independent transporter DctP family solute receptor